METSKFETDKAIEYAYKWALNRNPEYYNFDNYDLGGDCTNFISQCLYAGSGIMNYTKIFGWYYKNLNSRSPSWSGVEYLYNFLLTNKSAGPFGSEINIEEAKPGDIIQLSFDGINYAHSMFILETDGKVAPENILIACHTYDSLLKPLSDYNYKKERFIRIEGVRRN